MSSQAYRERRTREAAERYAAKLCKECGLPGLERSRNNIREVHVACHRDRVRRAQRAGDRLRAALTAERHEFKLCEECGLPGLEPAPRSLRRFHVACVRTRANRQRRLRRADPEYRAAELATDRAARERARAERYKSDPEYRARADVIAQFSLKGRHPLEASKIRVLWTRYRLREPDFYRLLAWQNDQCPCGEPFGPLHGARALVPHVDHDHRCCPGGSSKTCGRCVRGLLHSSCNVLVAMIESHPDVCEPRGWVEKYLADPPYRQMLRVAARPPA